MSDSLMAVFRDVVNKTNEPLLRMEEIQGGYKYFSFFMANPIRLIALVVFIFVSGFVSGQGGIVDHWETIIFADDTMKYFIGIEEPPSDWNEMSFDDNSWLTGRGGIGYGDGDDNTILPDSTLSVYLRKTFEIIDISVIEKAILHVDYDDGYVAYLNGKEISRSNIGTPGIRPSYNQTADSWHEAVFYEGGIPESQMISGAFLKDHLVDGENLLALQVHNRDTGSSDMSSLIWFSVGLSEAGQTYRETPGWFVPPVDFSSSDLPLVIIESYGQAIPDEPKIISFMGIIENGPGSINRVGDSMNVYSGRIMIERRGESSDYYYPKKSYQFETQDSSGANLNVPLLGMPAENDWILYGPYGDKSMIRNVLSFYFAELTGQYAPRSRYCELVLNGDYRGTYLLMEKIKRDDDRLPLAKLLLTDTAGVEVTGGYILRIDKLDDISPEDGWYSESDPPPSDAGLTYLQYYYPKTREIAPAQQVYIQSYIREFESALNRSDFTDPVSGYKKYVDMDSFIDYFLVCEMSKDIDNFKYSIYLYKHKDTDGGKLHMGPVWDNNLGFGNADFSVDGAESPEGWLYLTVWRLYWFRRMMEDSSFRNRLKCRWEDLRKREFNVDHLVHFTDSIADLIDASQTRNYERWPILDTWVWPNNYIGYTYENEYHFVIDWMVNRISWMDANVPGTCTSTGTNQIKKTISYGVNVYPNPFTSTVTLYYYMEDAGEVTIRIVNLIGQEVKVFHDPRVETGYHHWSWDGTDNMGNKVSNGIFLLILNVHGEPVFTEKIIKQ